MLVHVGHAGLEGLDVAVQEAGLLLAELDAHGLDDGLLAYDLGLLRDVGAEEDDVRALEVADALGYLVAGDVDGVDVGAGGLDVDDGAVDEQQAAGLDVALELEEGGLVMARMVSAWAISGLATGLSETTTEQLAVPPRISGP